MNGDDRASRRRREVPERRMKRLAEDEASSVCGVADVENRLRVTRR